MSRAFGWLDAFGAGAHSRSSRRLSGRTTTQPSSIEEEGFGKKLTSGTISWRPWRLPVLDLLRPAGSQSTVRSMAGKHLTMLVQLIAVGALGLSTTQAENAALADLRLEYPKASFSYVSNRLPSGEVVVCGYANGEGVLFSQPFVWRGGKLVSWSKLANLPSQKWRQLCGGSFVAPAVRNPVP